MLFIFKLSRHESGAVEVCIRRDTILECADKNMSNHKCFINHVFYVARCFLP